MSAPHLHHGRTAARGLWVAATVMALGVAAALGLAGWRACGSRGERCDQTWQFPGYNTETGAIDLVMHDLNRNGVIDTWIYRDGRHIQEIEIDLDEDGAIDRLLTPDEHGTLRVADGSRDR